MKEKIFFLFLILFFVLLIPLTTNKAKAAYGDDCTPPPWSGSCDCDSDLACIRTGYGQYSCLPPLKEGYDCTTLVCKECGKGLDCKRAGFGTYVCTANGADPDNYMCNPWTNQPCGGGEKCQRVSWGHYECSADVTAKNLCYGLPTACDDCITNKNGMWTALGCIPVGNLNDFIGWLLGNLIYIASGIAFLLMAFGAIQIITSSGNLDKVKAGQELISSAIAGLLFIILSLFLLKLIGVDILHIPGFAK